MSTNLSAKYYQENKKRLQTKKAHEGYQIFLKKKRKKKAKTWSWTKQKSVRRCKN